MSDMFKKKRVTIGRQGFTMTEVVVAVGITAFIIAGTLSVFIFGLRSYHEESIKNQLNMDLEIATEYLRRDLRLSSLCLGGHMAFYPALSNEYEAISMPLAVDDDGDNLLERDDMGKILWDETVIYHVKTGMPDKLVRSIFAPKNTNATPAQIYAQLVKVVDGETTTAALPGETYSFKVIFENLVNVKIRPIPTVYDGYADTNQLERNFNFGSMVIGPGNHYLKLELAMDLGGKNMASSGYKLGVDRFNMTPSDSWSEGEFYMTTNHYGVFTYSNSPGSSVTEEDMSSVPNYIWSGDRQMSYVPPSVAAATAPWLGFNVYNDCWIDSTFNTVGGIYLDSASIKSNDVVSMDKGITWQVDWIRQPMATNLTIDGGANTTLTTVIYGMKAGSYASRGDTRYNGHWLRVKFNGPGTGTNTCGIVGAGFGGYPTGSYTVLSFDGGNLSTEIAVGDSKWSDWANIEFEKKESYHVSFKIMNDPNKDSTLYWPGLQASNTLVNSTQWDSNIYCISEIEVRYPDEGFYRSGVFDTRTAAPVYKKLRWQHVEKNSAGGDFWSGGMLAGDVDMKLRSGTTATMTNSTWKKGMLQLEAQYFDGDADPEEDLVAWFLPNDRYLQYEAMFTCEGTADNQYSSELIDVMIDWEGEIGPIDLNMDLGKGPDYGMYYATIDGRTLARALEIDMTIFKEFKLAGRTQTVRGTMSIAPLNTGK